MKKTTVILAVLALAAFAGQISVNLDPIDRSDADWLVYDNGSPAWLTWGGVYRGVWFNVDDFYTGALGASIEQSQFWFYHHASYPWDTSSFYAEIWNGTAPNITTLLDQSTGTAVHYAPVFVSYATPIVTEPNFWCFTNTVMSSGGWPASLGDGGPSAVAHSYNGDTSALIPWVVASQNCNYFISVLADPVVSLSRTTWGSMKTVF
ncbi:MAG: hypothetical protein K8S62_06840 [Candidatus Sabulitectum sp.]|nr:hypothetical protein [Candidatus Sabulitectum sp.]